MNNPCEKCCDESYEVWDSCDGPCPDLIEFEDMKGYDEDDDGFFLEYTWRVK